MNQKLTYFSPSVVLTMGSTLEEQAQFEKDATGMSLGVYIRFRLFDSWTIKYQRTTNIRQISSLEVGTVDFIHQSGSNIVSSKRVL